MGRAEDIFEALMRGGLAAIDEYIATRTSEELFLDFKRSADHGASTNLHQDDRNNLAKAISGFGNSAGGVIVWGVDCSRDKRHGDVADKKYPLVKPARFKSLLEGAVSGATMPPHGGVRHHIISAGTPETGFVASLIPSSNYAPHQTLWGGPQYYMRAGSSFVPVPHTVLAGMFGRRPQPALTHRYEVLAPSAVSTAQGEAVEVVIRLAIHNDGLGIADNIFFDGETLSLPGRNCVIRPRFTHGHWTGQISGRNFCAIAHNDQKVAPRGWAIACDFHIHLVPLIDSALIVEGRYGCAGTVHTNRFRFSLSEALISDRLRRYRMIVQEDGAEYALCEFGDALRQSIRVDQFE